jgi:galactarate dehydratase
VHDSDNVAIIVNEQSLAAGTHFPDGLTRVEHVSQDHKVVLQDIPQAGNIIRYGATVIFFEVTEVRDAIHRLPQSG